MPSSPEDSPRVGPEDPSVSVESGAGSATDRDPASPGLKAPPTQDADATGPHTVQRVQPHGASPGRPPSPESAAELATSRSDVSASLPAADTSLVTMLTYSLTLPERTVRSSSALVGGLVNETAGRLIPAAFRSSRSYETFVQQALDMMIHDIGGVDPSGKDTASEPEAALAQKAVGGLLDIAGTATLHLSPLTVLAVFNDVAYGSGFYLRRLGEELKREGVIDAESSIDHVSDLIEALQRTSRQATDVVNAPPVSVDGLAETIAKLSGEISRIDPLKVLPQAEVKRLWTEMEQTASRQNVGLWDVGATMTMFAMNRLSLTTRGALTTVHVAGDLLDEHILQHYAAGLDQIQQQGLYRTLSEASEPYVNAVWRNFDGQRETWTEQLVSGRLFSTAWTGLRGWLRSSSPSDEPPA